MKQISRETNDNGSRYSTGFLFILPIISAINLIGNVALLIAIKLFRVRRGPDLLVGSLLGIDLLNDIGPVLMSIIVFQIDQNAQTLVSPYVTFTTGCPWMNWQLFCMHLN